MLTHDYLCFLNKQKSFTDFLKSKQVKFTRVASASGDIITTTSNFPRLVFRFEPETDYITVWKVTGEGYTRPNGEYVQVFRSYSFPCCSCYRVIAKLLQYRLISIGEVKRMKI